MKDLKVEINNIIDCLDAHLTDENRELLIQYIIKETIDDDDEKSAKVYLAKCILGNVLVLEIAKDLGTNGNLKEILSHSMLPEKAMLIAYIVHYKNVIKELQF